MACGGCGHKYQRPAQPSNPMSPNRQVRAWSYRNKRSQSPTVTPPAQEQPVSTEVGIPKPIPDGQKGA
jgi:hypothetical protein